MLPPVITRLLRRIMKLLKSNQKKVMRRKHPCFDFIRNVIINVEKNSVVENDNKKCNLLTNLTADNVASEEDYKRKSRRYPNILRKLRTLTHKLMVNISRTPRTMSSLSSAKNVSTRPLIQHLYSYSQILWVDNDYEDNNYLTMKTIDNIRQENNIYV